MGERGKVEGGKCGGDVIGEKGVRTRACGFYVRSWVNWDLYDCFHFMLLSCLHYCWLLLVLSGWVLLWLVLQILVDLGHNLWCQAREQLQTLDIVNNLLWPRGTGDHGGDILIL